MVTSVLYSCLPSIIGYFSISISVLVWRGMRLRYIYILQVHSIAMVFVFVVFARYPKVYLVYYKYEELATKTSSAKEEGHARTTSAQCTTKLITSSSEAELFA